jgi:hypothetical protein
MSIYDRLKSQPLMRMQEGGEAMTPEQQAFLDKYVQEAITNFLGGNFTTPGIDLGGGLGGMPGVTLNMQDILAGLPQNQMYGIPTVFTDPVEDEVVEDEVVEDEVETTAPVMPVAPVNDPVVEVVSDEVAEEVAPTPTPAPAPAPAPVVPTTGIGTLPQVVLPPTPAEEMNLITGTDAPLTEEEIYNVATPTMTPTTGNDIARLNQQYNDTFLKMLVQDPVNAQAAAPVYDSNSEKVKVLGYWVVNLLAVTLKALTKVTWLLELQVQLQAVLQCKICLTTTVITNKLTQLLRISISNG